MSRRATWAPLEGRSLFHIRGAAARSALEAVVAAAPTSVLTAWTLPEGGFIACLGKKEYLLLTSAARQLLEPIRQDNLTVTARSDSVFHVSGEQAEAWLQQTSPVNLSIRPEQDFLLSSLLKIGCWLTRASIDGAGQEGFLIGCDPTYGDYFSDALTQSLQDFEAALTAA